MPAYRLIADHGTPVETFEAADDAAGERQGRALAARMMTTWEVGYRLEREGADGWRAVTTWLPRGVVGGPGPQGTVRRPR